MKQQITYLLLLLLGFTACQSENDTVDPTPQPQQTNVTLVVEIPTVRTPTYGMSAANEDKVNELTVLVFKDDAGVKRLEKKYVIVAGSPDITNITGGKMRVMIGFHPGVYDRIILVANANAQLAGMTEGTSTIADLDNIEYTHATGKWDATTPAYIPMSASLIATSTNGLDISSPRTFDGLKLVRMLARIDIKNDAHANFTLHDVYVYNMNRNGKIVADANYLTASPRQPNLPTTPLLATPNPISYNYATLQSGNKMENEIYVFENKAPTTATVATSVRVIIRGLYSGQYYYYPLDFTHDGTVAGTTRGSYMPVVRNHKYIFTIKQVNGIGFTTLAEALASPNVSTNITVKLLTIDADFTDVYYNTHAYLAVNDQEFKFDNAARTIASTDNKFDILTDNNTGWTITCTEADGFTAPVGNWLRTSPVLGAKDVKATVSVMTTVATTERVGYVIIKAGSLVAKIKVTQDLCGRNGVAKMQSIGGKYYGTHYYAIGTTNEKCWMVQNIRNGTTGSGLTNAIATDFGQGVGQDGSFIAGADGRGSGEYYYTISQAFYACPAGWRLPNNAQWEALKTDINTPTNRLTTGKWWAWGNGATNGAFAGRFNTHWESWEGWKARGDWWTAGGNFYISLSSGMIGPGATGQPLWNSVRCVQD